MKSSCATPRVERTRAAMFLAVVLGLVALVAPSTAAVVGATAEPDLVVGSATLEGSASAYVPINPVRILDTRTDPDMKRMFDNTSLSIDPVTSTGVADAAGVLPGDITAVIVNTTMVRSGGIGFGTVWPTGSERLQTSTNNTEFDGHTIPNLVIAPLGMDGKISVYSSTEADIILDVLGVFVASGPTSAGRFESLGPTRAYDSREGDAEIPAGGTVTIDLTDAGVPEDAIGVVLNVTAVRSRGRGYYRVWSADEPAPAHSSVNVLGVEYNAGNQVITGVADGRIQVFSDIGGGLTVDVTGYLTGPNAEPSTDGLFVPFTPGRLLDTRSTAARPAGNVGEKVAGDERYELPIAGRLDVPETGAKAVALNLTAVRGSARGFVKAYAQGADEPDTSSLNFTDPGQIVPNHAITSLNEDNGRITIQPSVSAHIVVDASGYFLAEGADLPEGGTGIAKTVNPGALVPTPLPGTSPTTGPYDFLFDRGDFFKNGRVRPDPTIKAAWDVCSPVRYALNVDLAENDEQIQVLITAIEEMESATGIDFQFGGVTSAGMNVADEVILPERDDLPFQYLPPDDDGSGAVDLVIGYSNEDDTPDLVGGIIGVGGSLRNLADASGRAEQVRGFAVIDLPDLYRNGEPAGGATLRNLKATVTHELGHMMGLGHVDTSIDGGGLNPGFSAEVIQAQLMFPALNRDTRDFAGGDLQGLFELYGNRSCAGSGSFNRNSAPTQGSPDGGSADGADRDDEIDLSGAVVVKSDDDF